MRSRRLLPFVVALVLVPLTAYAAGVPELPRQTPLLTMGSHGPAVAALQRALAELGFDPGPPDGVFGPRTREAVRAFQKRAGVAADGRVGPATWTKLSAVLQRAFVVHEVQRGDTLAAIARRYGVPLRQLIADNELADPNRLRPGERVLVRRNPWQPTSTPAAGGASGGGSQDQGGSGRTGAGGAESRSPSPPAGAGRAAPGDAGGSRTGMVGERRSTIPVALTFNDGPDPTVTPVLLDALRRFNVRATFFVVGAAAERHPDLIRSMVDDGHEVESHGYEHRPVADLPIEDIRADIARAAATIERLTGRRPLYYRPPEARLSASVLAAAQAEGERILLWTNVGAEHDPSLSATELLRRLVGAAHPGAVLMLHADRPGVAELVTALLAEFDKRDVAALPLGELLRVARR